MSALSPTYHYDLRDPSAPLHAVEDGPLALCGAKVGGSSELIGARVCLWCWRQSLLNELSRVDRMIEEEAR